MPNCQSYWPHGNLLFVQSCCPSLCSSLDWIPAPILIAQNPNPGSSPAKSCAVASARRRLSSAPLSSVLNMEVMCRSQRSGAAAFCSMVDTLVAETALAVERSLLWFLLAMVSISSQTLTPIEEPEEIYRILAKSTQEALPENKDDGESDDNDDKDDDNDDGEDQDADGGEEDYSGEENDKEGDENDDPVANGEGGSEEEDDEEDDEDDEEDEDEEEDEEDEEEDEELPQPPTKKRK